MKRPPLLFLNVLIVATCGLIYELLAGTLASYALGDSVTQFSLIIGIYLFAMGSVPGSRALSTRPRATVCRYRAGRSDTRRFLRSFVIHHVRAHQLFLCDPLRRRFRDRRLCRIRNPASAAHPEEQIEFKELVSRVLAFDYIGALLASILFPIFFVPRLGLIRVASLRNAECRRRFVGHVAAAPADQGSIVSLRVKSVVVMALLLIGLVKANTLTSLMKTRCLPTRSSTRKTRLTSES